MVTYVNTQIIKIDPEQPDEKIIRKAADILVGGGLVAFPTETVYGLGANAFDSQAVEKIFAAKNRPSTDPLIVHINDLNQIDDVAINIPQWTWVLADKFWPGPLTMILERNPKISGMVSSGLSTVAVRWPNHKVPHSLIRTAGIPIAAPSANLFARPSPTTAAHVYHDLKGRVALILDGGPCTIGLESTVLDLTQEHPVLLRPGGYSLELLRQILPNIIIGSMYLNLDENAIPSASPGMLSKHYSPKALVLPFIGERLLALSTMVDVTKQLFSNNISVGVLAANEDKRYFDELAVKLAELGSLNNMKQIGSNLFAGIRELDHQQVDVILARDFGREGLGLAIWDRLIRASKGFYIDPAVDAPVTIKINEKELNLLIRTES
jgi:L-threonylcarbamoyladenylate synthase